MHEQKDEDCGAGLDKEETDRKNKAIERMIKEVAREQKIDESTQAVVVARLKALPSGSVAMFWRCWMVDRVRDFTNETMPAVKQVLKNLEKEVGIR